MGLVGRYRADAIEREFANSAGTGTGTEHGDGDGDEYGDEHPYSDGDTDCDSVTDGTEHHGVRARGEGWTVWNCVQHIG
jgi:hypothetical protein